MNAEEYLSGQRVNVELILWTNDKNILHYGLRIRPWKQETRIGAMILVQGLSVPDALRNGARAHVRNEWEKLDYAARPWNLRTPGTIDAETPQQLDFLDLVPEELPRNGDTMYAPTPIDKKAR